MLPSTVIPSSSPKQNVSFSINQSVSIPPRPIYHPAMQGKQRSKLTAEEVHKFDFYREYKLKNGE